MHPLRSHAVAGIEKVASKQSAATANLHHEAFALSDRFEERENAGSHQVGVKSEAEVMNQG